MDFCEGMEMLEEMTSTLVGLDAEHVQYAVKEVICIAKEVAILMPTTGDTALGNKKMGDMVKTAKTSLGWIHYLRRLSCLVYEKLQFDDYLNDD